MSNTRHEVQSSLLKRVLLYKLWDRNSQAANFLFAAILTALLALIWPEGEDPLLQVLWLALILSFWIEFVRVARRRAREQLDQMTEMKLRIELLEIQVRQLKGQSGDDMKRGQPL
jgi:hypothetical protein